MYQNLAGRQGFGHTAPAVGDYPAQEYRHHLAHLDLKDDHRALRRWSLLLLALCLLQAVGLFVVSRAHALVVRELG